MTITKQQVLAYVKGMQESMYEAMHKGLDYCEGFFEAYDFVIQDLEGFVNTRYYVTGFMPTPESYNPTEKDNGFMACYKLSREVMHNILD